MGVAARNTQSRALMQQRLRDVAAQKPAATKNRYQLALHKCSVSPRETLRALCTTARQLSRPTCARLQIIDPPCALSLASYDLLGNGICCAFIEPCA
jgi:hypothetical protein